MAGKSRYNVIVTDPTGKTVTYTSMKDAGQALKIGFNSLRRLAKTGEFTKSGHRVTMQILKDVRGSGRPNFNVRTTIRADLFDRVQTYVEAQKETLENYFKTIIEREVTAQISVGAI